MSLLGVYLSSDVPDTSENVDARPKRPCGGLERADFKQFLLWVDVVVLKEMILAVSIFGRYGGLQRTDFEQFLYWEGVVVLK